jgi:hypothetical protein
MDINTTLLSTGTGGTLLMVLLYLYKTLNHRRCRSRCCGKNFDASLDIEQTTPPQERFEVSNPVRNRDLPISVIVP